MHAAVARGEDPQRGVGFVLEEDAERFGLNQGAYVLAEDREQAFDAGVLRVVGLGPLEDVIR